MALAPAFVLAPTVQHRGPVVTWPGTHRPITCGGWVGVPRYYPKFPEIEHVSEEIPAEEMNLYMNLYGTFFVK